jgi:NhaA family Na+:H+ antiporter
MRSGLHATLAGFVLGLLVPATPFQRPAAVSAAAHRVADETVDHPDPPDADAEAWLSLAALSRQAVSPLVLLETGLHPWTSNLIVPAFALANAGVTLTRSNVAATLTGAVFVAVLVARVLGKTAGIPLGAFAATRSGIGRRQPGIGVPELLALGGAAGMGFTVPLLVIELAFGAGPLEDQAKAGVLAASVVAAAVGAVLMAFARRRGQPDAGSGSGSQR